MASLMKLAGGLALLLLLLAASVAVVTWITIPPALDPNSLPSHPLDLPASAHLESIEHGRALARAVVAEEKLPGLSLAVAVDGAIVWAEGFRHADLENQTPVTPATRFRIGGVSATLTAAAVGLLQERGRLDLDAPVQSYLPNFPDKEWPITTRQLMAHTASIRPYSGESGIFRGSCTSDAERLATFAGDPLLVRPGTAVRYSSNGWVLVGAVVAAAAGEPYLEFVRREVLIPLGMVSTAPDSAEPTGTDRAHFYYPRLMLNPRYGLQDAPTVDLSCHLAAVGFLSTPSDLVRFASAMMGNELLAPATVAQLHTPIQLESGELTEHALGWTVATVPLGVDGAATRIVGQGLGETVLRRPLSATTRGGQVAGGTASLLTVPAQRIAVAVTSNVSGAENVPALAAQLVNIFLDARAAPTP